MNFFEMQIAKLEPRIKKIRANPDPTRLRATAMLFELERDLRVHQLESWKAGRPFCFGTNLHSIATSLGFEYLQPVSEADRVTNAAQYFDVLRARGYPDHHCDRTIVAVGMVMAGDLPEPTMSVSTNHACDPEMLTGHFLGEYYPGHHYCIDIDAVDDGPSERQLQYVTSQLGDWIEYCETKIPGIKYNEDRMLELMDMDRQSVACQKEIYELRKRVPCPVAGRDVFRHSFPPSHFPDPKKAVEYYQILRDEIGERAAKGIGAVKEEKARIMWSITAPFFANVFPILEEQGASIVQFQVGAAMRRYGGPRGYFGDETEYGRKLLPLEDQARALTRNSWAGLTKRWVDDMIYFCKDLRVDGIVHFEQWGCVAAVLARKVVQDRVEAELGIPNLFIEGRNLDTSTFDIRQFRVRLEQFLEVCIDKKTQRALAS